METTNKRIVTLIQTIDPNCITLHVGKQGVCSVEVRALTPVFGKSATKPNLLRCKIDIATYNLRILNTINQLLKLTAPAAKHNLDICMQEHRYYHSELELKYHVTKIVGHLSSHLHGGGELSQCCYRRCKNASRSFYLKTTK